MERVIRLLETIDERIYKIQKVLFVVIVAIVVAVNTIQIAGRYLFKYSIPWSDQVSLLIFCMIIMLGGNIAIKEHSEIKVELIRFKSARRQAAMNLIGDLISIVTLVIFIISNLYLIKQASQFSKVISSIQLEYKYVYMIVLVGFLLMLYDKILMTLKDFYSLNPEGGRG